MSEAEKDLELLRRYLATHTVSCPECGYELYRLESGTCPECGVELHLSMFNLRPSRTEWISGGAGLWVALVINGAAALIFGIMPVAGIGLPMVGLAVAVAALVAWHGTTG